MTRALRLLVFTALAAYLFVLPALGQLTGRPIPGVREWHMYAGMGTDICQVRYESADGRVLDRLGSLPSRTGPSARAQRFLADAGAVDRQGAQLCAALGLDDVRAAARCGSRDRWVTTHRLDRNLCGGARRAPKGRP